MNIYLYICFFLLNFHLIFSQQLLDNIINISNLETPQAFNIINPENLPTENYFGNILQRAGDINNDGYQDAIIGYQYILNSPTDYASTFFIYYGNSRYASSGIQQINKILADNSYRFKVTVSGSFFPILPEGIGDVNNDGIDDFIIKVAIESPGEGYILAFVIYGVQGTRSDITIVNNNIDPNFGFRILADINNESHNNAVAGFGDFNGDGIDDIALSIRGGVSIIFGINGNRNDFIVSNPINDSLNKKILDLTQNNEVTSLEFCDVNNDGKSDLLIGQIDSFLVVYGTDDSSTIQISASSPITANVGYRVIGQQNSFFAFSLKCAGDFNGDGIKDIVVGAPFYDESNTSNDNGATYVIYGTQLKNKALLNAETMPITDGFKISTIQDPIFLGYSVDGIGDFNGDGLDDIAMTAPNYMGTDGVTGIVIVLYGSNNIQSNIILSENPLKSNEGVGFVAMRVLNFDMRLSGLGGNFNNYLTSDFMYSDGSSEKVYFILDFSTLIQSNTPTLAPTTIAPINPPIFKGKVGKTINKMKQKVKVKKNKNSNNGKLN